MNESVLTMQDISLSFSGVRVLEDAHFSLERNVVHAIVGKNGAGKSSFMKVLTGVYKPDTGVVDRSERVAMVYQDLSLIPSMSVLQNIFLQYNPYTRFGLLRDAPARKQAVLLLEQVGLSQISPDRLVDTLSAGEAQLVEIAKAIASRAGIIVFDEPTASLSDVEITALFRTITALQKQGMSIIYITHYLKDVMQISQRVTVLRDGRVVSVRTTKDTDMESIISDMLGQDLQTQSRRRQKIRTEEETEPLLELQDAKTEQLGPVSLTALPGEIIGIAGLLGSGRTELLRMIYGLDPLKSGNIRIQGQSARISNPQQAAKYGISLLPEERRRQGLVLDFDIAENIALSNLQHILRYGIINAKLLAQLAENMISRLQISTTGRKQITRFLSGGNQQKVVLGKCLANKPRILLLDDPTFGIDIHAKSEIMHIIQNFVDEGRTALFVSSEFSEIASFCDRTYIIKKRQISSAIQNRSITEEELLKQVQ